MADRFWVGGAGTWNTTSTTNWSATSGGASGASVPTVADSVFFDQAGTYTVTMTGALACLDITVSAGTVTFSQGTSPTLEIRGSMTLLAGTVWSSSAAITFSSTTTGRTVTTNGTSIAGRITFNGVGGGWTLGSALTTTAATSSFAVLAGTFDTSSVGNYSITCGAFLSNGVLARTLNLNASTITFGVGAAGAIFTMTSTSITFNAGTSTLVVVPNGITFAGAGLTYYNLLFTNTTSGQHNITGANTFNNITVTNPTTVTFGLVTFAANQTINGTLSTTGTAGNRRVFFTTATYGISYDLVVNSAPSLTDADFRGLYVRGTAAPISGTRIGNRGECRGITFDAPKTVYWNLAGAQNWNADGWCAASGGTPNTDNFPLPQDTAIFDNASAISQIVLNAQALSTIDFSSRTSFISVGVNVGNTIYGNWANGSSMSFTGNGPLTFSGGTTQTITSAGRTFSCGIIVDTYGGTVQLADALNIGSQTLTVTNGTFNTAGYAVAAGVLSSSNSNVRTINLGASTVTLTATVSQLEFNIKTNLTFNAGTSSISITTAVGGSNTLSLSGLVFNNFTYTNNAGSTSFTLTLTGANTFNNATFSFPSGFILDVVFQDTQTINGALTCAGAAAAQRIFLRSNTSGTPRILTVNTLSATDCDFRDITLAGAASGTSPTRAGDCGGNTGITFPAPKTVYWNLAGTQNWDATGWATSSGGTPATNNFPLAQDTAVIDDTGAVGTLRITAPWNIGTVDASLRTSAMTFTVNAGVSSRVYGEWKFGTGVTSTSTTGTVGFSKNGTQTITSNGVQFNCNVDINHPLANVQLADALSLGSTRTLTLTTGTFDAVTYNVTIGVFLQANIASGSTLKMGSGTWTVSGTGSVWSASSGSNISTFVGTSTIVLSDTSASARTFAGAGLYYNKLTIGGTTGTSTLTITGNNTFGELASTKTVAHTIDFGTTTQTFGKWSVTGTVGNRVTITGTSTTNVIAGPAVTGVGHLIMGGWGVSTTSPGEFYAGANSTGTASAPVFRTDAPAPRTLYWVGGTGNWSSTTKWSTSSGGGSGAAIPTSLDAVVFDSASNATAYTATIDAGVTLARCASFTMAGPASGNVTFAGTVGIAFHGDVSFAATGITRTYTGAMNWTGNGSYTFTTNGLALASGCTVTGVGSAWTLGSALNAGAGTFTFTYGAFSTSASNYSLTCSALSSNNSSTRSISLNGSTLTLVSSQPIVFTNPINLTFNAGTSTITMDASAPTFNGGNQTFNAVIFNQPASLIATIAGANTFNTLSFSGRTSVGISSVTFNADQTIGTLTLNAGTASAYRTFLASNTIGTQRTLNVTTLTAGAADIDFRDIAVTGAAAPLTGTRFGDAKGNSGITFPAAKTVYWAQATSNNWGSTGAGSWSATNGGAAANTQFPLAQDTAFIPFAIPNNNQTITVNANYNIGTLDMNERNGSALVTLATGATTPTIYGNWINGTGTTLTSLGTSVMTFAGRGSQTITSAGSTFPQLVTVNSLGGSVTLQDAFSIGSISITILAGTFDAGGYNVTMGSTNASVVLSGALTRTLIVGSGLWSIPGSGTAWTVSGANATVTGTGTISLTSASSKTFAGGGVNYSGITLNQGGAGTLTITGNNTFKDITNTYSATGAASIAMGNTTQTVTQWSGTGEAGRVLTLTGTSAASPATLIISGAVNSSTDYLNISNVRGYPVASTWYIGANSTNSGSLGFLFEASGGTVYNVDIIETAQGIDALLAALALSASLQESTQAADSVSVAASDFNAAASESAQVSDAASATAVLFGSISDAATGQDTAVAFVVLPVSVAESAQALDQAAGGLLFSANISELATGLDSVLAQATLNASAAETAQGADQTAVAASTFNAQASETGTASDAQSAATTFPASLSEQARVQDSTAAALVVSGSVSEIAAALDSLIAGSGYFVNVAEQAAALDAQNAAAAFSGAAAETARGSDANSANAQFQSRVTELGAGQDSITTTASLQGFANESAQALDAVTPTKTTNPTVAESVTASDVAQAFLALSGAISETARSSDSAATVVVFVGAVAEQLSAADLTSVAASIFGAAAQEQAQAQDSVNAPGSTYNPTATEAAQAQDQSAAAATFPVAVADAASVSDADSAAFTAATNIAESAQASEITFALAAFAALTAETASAADQTSVAPSVFSAIAVAAAQAADSLNAPGSVYNASVADSATALDSLIGGYLWNLINDDQNPNWGPVNNTQTVTWTAIDDSQSPNWQNVANAQGSGWTPVNTDDDPNWQPAITP